MYIDYFVIGFLWGSARISGDHLLVQNSSKKLLQKVKKLGGFENKIFSTITTNRSKSWRMKIHKTNRYVVYMLNNGYEGRKGNQERSVPTSLNLNNEYEFLKGYYSTHYTIDLARGGYTFKRLRFYATKNILETLNKHLHKELDTTIKKIGNHSQSNVCKILYYQSKKEVPKIIEYLGLGDKV